MKIVRGRGKSRTEVARVQSPALHGVLAAVDTVPDREKTSGRFTKGNRAFMRRTLRLKHRNRELLVLDPNKVEPFLKPHVLPARKHLHDLLSELPETVSVNAIALAEELSMMRAMSRALFALAATGDKDAMREARAWLTQARQNTIALSVLVGTRSGTKAEDDLLGWVGGVDTPRSGSSRSAVDDGNKPHNDNEGDDDDND